jgi:hypothetical protein
MPARVSMLHSATVETGPPKAILLCCISSIAHGL